MTNRPEPDRKVRRKRKNDEISLFGWLIWWRGLFASITPDRLTAALLSVSKAYQDKIETAGAAYRAFYALSIFMLIFLLVMVPLALFSDDISAVLLPWWFVASAVITGVIMSLLEYLSDFEPVSRTDSEHQDENPDDSVEAATDFGGEHYGRADEPQRRERKGDE